MAKSATTWGKGTSGNPRGRPRGSAPRAKFRQQVAAAVPKIVDGLVAAALAGDVAAAKIIMDRYMPALKPADEPITLELPAGALSNSVSRGPGMSCGGPATRHLIGRENRRRSGNN
jgi:hypothetical protein